MSVGTFNSGGNPAPVRELEPIVMPNTTKHINSKITGTRGKVIGLILAGTSLVALAGGSIATIAGNMGLRKTTDNKEVATATDNIASETSASAANIVAGSDDDDPAENAVQLTSYPAKQPETTTVSDSVQNARVIPLDSPELEGLAGGLPTTIIRTTMDITKTDENGRTIVVQEDVDVLVAVMRDDDAQYLGKVVHAVEGREEGTVAKDLLIETYAEYVIRVLKEKSPYNKDTAVAVASICSEYKEMTGDIDAAKKVMKRCFEHLASQPGAYRSLFEVELEEMNFGDYSLDHTRRMIKQ